MAEREEPEGEGTGPAEDASGRDAPLDEEAAWRQLVASFTAAPEPGEGGWPAAEDLPEERPGDPPAPEPVVPVIRKVYVVRAPGPRDYAPDDDGEEGHFVPPEPPPLPEADTTTKFAWVAVLGGPALLLFYVFTGEAVPTWALVLGVGGFLGGFATLVARMRDRGEDEDDDPHGGAVV